MMHRNEQVSIKATRFVIRRMWLDVQLEKQRNNKETKELFWKYQLLDELNVDNVIMIEEKLDYVCLCSWE